MIKFTTRIHEAASSDQTRAVLCHVKVTGDMAYATDSYVMARAPVQGELDGLVPVEAVKKAWSSTGREPTSWHVAHEGEVWKVISVKATTLFPNGLSPDVRFPDCQRLLGETTDRLLHADSALTVAVDAEKLLRAARAVCPGKDAFILLTVDSDVVHHSRPMMVQPQDKSVDAVAIVMPMRQK